MDILKNCPRTYDCAKPEDPQKIQKNKHLAYIIIPGSTLAEK